VLESFACTSLASIPRSATTFFAVRPWVDQSFLLASAGSYVAWSCHLFSDVCLRVHNHDVFVWRVSVLPCCVSIAAVVNLA